MRQLYKHKENTRAVYTGGVFDYESARTLLTRELFVILKKVLYAIIVFDNRYNDIVCFVVGVIITW